MNIVACMKRALAHFPDSLTFVPIEICGGIDLAMDLLQVLVCEGIRRRRVVEVAWEELGF